MIDSSVAIVDGLEGQIQIAHIGSHGLFSFYKIQDITAAKVKYKAVATIYPMVIGS